jgi:hypothetical protein
MTLTMMTGMLELSVVHVLKGLSNVDEETTGKPTKYVQAMSQLKIPVTLFYIIVSNLIYHPICFARATARISASSA